MGAAALLHLLSQTPDRFERLVFFLPAALDSVRPEGQARLDELARLVDAGDPEQLAAALLAYLPAAVRDSRVAAVHARGSAAELVGTDVPRVMRAIGQTGAVVQRWTCWRPSGCLRWSSARKATTSIGWSLPGGWRRPCRTPGWKSSGRAARCGRSAVDCAPY